MSQKVRDNRYYFIPVGRPEGPILGIFVDVLFQEVFNVTGQIDTSDSSDSEHEVDDVLRESTVFIYKGEHPTWRIGPDPHDPRCWIYTDYTGTFEDFEQNQGKDQTFH